MNIEHIMCKNLIVMDENSTIYDVSNQMKKCDIGFLIFKNKEKITGIITDRDIVVRCVSVNADLDCCIKPYITTEIISLECAANCQEALELMCKHKVKRLLITDNNKVVGVLSISDIISTDIDSLILKKSLANIWEITKNIDCFDAEVDEFYL